MSYDEQYSGGDYQTQYDEYGGYYDEYGGYYDASGYYYPPEGQADATQSYNYDANGSGSGYGEYNAETHDSAAVVPAIDTAGAAATAIVAATEQEPEPVASAFGNAEAYATPRPETPPPHWREKEITKRMYNRANKRRIGGLLATAGMKQLRNEVLTYEERTSKNLEILRSKQTLKLKQAIDQSRRDVIKQNHTSQLLMRCVETQQNIASRFKTNQDVARPDLLKQIPGLSSVQERVHRLRSLYTSKAAAESKAAHEKEAAEARAKARAGAGAGGHGKNIKLPPTSPVGGARSSSAPVTPSDSSSRPKATKEWMSGKRRVKEELKTLKPMPVATMYKHLRDQDGLEQQLEAKRALTTVAPLAKPGDDPGHGHGHGHGPSAGQPQEEPTDPYEINRLRNEKKLLNLLKEKHHNEALESGIDPETGCIAPQCPLRLKAKAIDGSTIQLTWDPPIFDGGQPIMDYIVYYTPTVVEHVGKRVKKEYGEEQHFFTTRFFKQDPVAHHGFTWRFHKSHTTVSRIHVRAINIVGHGAASNIVPEVTLPHPDNPSRPTNVCVDKVTTRSIYVRWQPPIEDGGTPITGYHITFNYLTWRDIKGPLRGGIGGRVTKNAHIEIEGGDVLRYKIKDLAGDTAYNRLCIQAVNADGRVSKRSTPIEGLRTEKCNELQMCQNEIDRVKDLNHPYCDTDLLTNGEVIQRLRRDRYLETLRDKFEILQEDGLELDPPSDDEAWLREGGIGSGSGKGDGTIVASKPKAKKKEWPMVKFNMYLPRGGRPGDEMLATAPSGWISHIVVPEDAIPGQMFEVEVENRPMRRQIVIRLEQYEKKIRKLHQQIGALNKQTEEWAGKKEFNAYRLQKLEQQFRIFSSEADRLQMHDEVYVDSVVMHGEGTAQRFKTEELKEMLENEMHSMKLSMSDYKQEMVVIEDKFKEKQRQVKFLEECLQERYAGQLATQRENRRKFRMKTILGHASHWFLGRALNSWCQFVEIRRDERAKMKQIMFAMQQCKLRAAMNKWVTTLRELDQLEEISDDLWGKGSRAIVRVRMLRRDIEGNLQLVLAKVRADAAKMDKYMSFTEKQIKEEFNSVHYRRKKRMLANQQVQEQKLTEKMSAAEQLEAKAKRQRIAAGRKLALAKLGQGEVSMSNKKYAEAFESFMRYLDYCRNGEPDHIDAYGMGVAYAHMGEVFEVWKEDNKALVCYIRSEGLGKEVEDAEIQAKALFRIGCIYFRQLKYPDAISKLGQAFDFFVELRNDVWKAKTLRELAKPYAAMFDDVKAASLTKAADKIENVLQNQLKEIDSKLSEMQVTINDTAPIHCTVVDIERCTATYPRLRRERRELVWKIEDIDRKMPDLEARAENAKTFKKEMKQLKKDCEAAPWSDFEADLGTGQVEKFKARDFKPKIDKAYLDSKAKSKMAADEVERHVTRRRNYEDDVGWS